MFCTVCCNESVGAEHERDRLKCKERCEEVINGEANVYLVSYQLKGKDKDIK